MPALRDSWADSAKGIGIVLVVYGHVARGVHTAGLPMDEHLFRLIDSVIYSFHMPLFFFLSGLYFVGSLYRHGVGGLIAGKLRTIAWPYLVWSILQGLTEVLLAGATNGKVTVAEVAALLWQPRAQFWFLYALFFISLVALAIYRWLPPRGYPWAVLASGLAWVFAAHLPGGVPLNFVIQYLPYFALGVWFNASPIVNRPVSRPLALSLAAFGMLVIFQYVFHFELDLSYTTDDRLMALLLATVSVLAIASLCLSLNGRVARVLALLGRASLPIYVLHILAGSGARIVMQKMLGIASAEIHLALGTLLGIALPLLAMRLMERCGLDVLFALKSRSFRLAAASGRA